MSDELDIATQPNPMEPAAAADTAVAAAEAAEPETFDREYVHELRQEAAKWRTQLRELEAEFDGIDPDERKALAEFVRLSRAAEAGDEDAAAALTEMLGGDDESAEEAPQAFDEEAYRRLAREEAQRLVEEREQARQQDDAIRSVQKQAEALGYEQGSEDYILLMRAANSLDPNEHSDLIAAADGVVKQYKQQIIEAYLASKEAATEGSPANGVGVAPSTATLPWTPEMTEKQKFAAVRASLSERIRQGT